MTTWVCCALWLSVGCASDAESFRLGEELLFEGDYAAARAAFLKLSQQESLLKDRAAYMSALSIYRAGQYEAAAREWADLTRRTEDEYAGARAQYGRAWAAIRLRDWAGAGMHLDRLPILFPESDLLHRGAFLRARLGDGPEFWRRSPSTARWLSTFLPGAGQIYAGRYGNGAISALLNGAFFYFLGKAVSDERWVDAAFIYFLGARFYWGGRQNAARFASEYNERETERFIERLGRMGR